MFKLDPHHFRTGVKPRINLCLYHYVRDSPEGNSGPRPPVLLLHGASANHQTFVTPGGGLAEFLAGKFDPWLLDWRGSGRVVDDERNAKSLLEQGRAYNFNLAARHDIPRAIRTIREKTNGSKVAAVGFCMGSAILAEAVALGCVTETDVDCIVLMTLGLFYETPIDGRLKCEDRLLERLQSTTPPGTAPVLSIDPRVDAARGDLPLRAPWRPELDNLYQSWPSALKSHSEEPRDAVNHTCNRLSFMYGMPYHHGNLVEEIHGIDSQGAKLPHLFGAIPLHMYIHGAKNIRQGHATFDDGEGHENFVSDLAREHFRSLKKVTLITGALNRLWHRDSIDLMHEWLCRGSSAHLPKFRKHILPNYGHQDLLWGKDSATDVFPKIQAGLE